MANPDIRIVKGSYSALIVPLSELGNRWIVANMWKREYEITVRIASEFLDEVRKEMEKDNIVIE